MASTGEWNMSEWENSLGFTDGLDDDIKGMDEIKLSTRLTKTKEEIEKFTIDDQMDEQQKATFLLKYQATQISGDARVTTLIDRNGAEIQKLSVLVSLSHHKHFTPEQKARLVPLLLEQLQQDHTTDFYLASAKVLSEIMAEEKLEGRVVNGMVPTIRKLMESKDVNIAGAWSDVMIASMQWLSMEFLETEILPEAILHSGLSQPVPYRLWSCRVFGAVAKRMDAKRIETTFLKKAMSLCQDTDSEVRACMCAQLNGIATAIGHELTKSVLLEEYMELLNDEEVTVKQTALTNLVQLFGAPLPERTNLQQLPALTAASSQSSLTVPSPATSIPHSSSLKRPTMLSGLTALGTRRSSNITGGPATTSTRPTLPVAPVTLPAIGTAPSLIDSDTKVNVIIPAWKKIYQEKSPALVATLCRQLGVFLWNTKEEMRDEDVEWFVAWFQKLALGKDATLRDLCVYNLPAIATFLATITPDPPAPTQAPKSSGVATPAQSALAANKVFPIILSVMEQLSVDESVEVRERIAGGFHEIVALLGKDAYRYLKTPWIRLVVDDEMDVSQTMFRSADAALRVFITDPNWSRTDPDFNQLLSQILKKHVKSLGTAKYKYWQILEVFRQFKNFPFYFDGEMVIGQVVPLVFAALVEVKSTTYTVCVRNAAIEVLCNYARYLPRQEHRQRIWAMFRDNLTNLDKTTYKMRLCYLEVVHQALQQFSAKFFKEKLAMDYLEMGRDPVANVRLKMVELLPAVRKTLKLPADSNLMQKLNDVVAFLVLQESDKGVAKVLNDFVENRTGSGSRDGLSAPPAPVALGKGGKPVSKLASSLAPLPSNPRLASPLGSVANSTNTLAPIATTPNTTTKSNWDLQDREKEEEEAQLLAKEAEMEDQRKKKDIEEVRQDLSKRLERNATAGGGNGIGATSGITAGIDKLSVKEKARTPSSGSFLSSGAGGGGKDLLGGNGLGSSSSGNAAKSTAKTTKRASMPFTPPANKPLTSASGSTTARLNSASKPLRSSNSNGSLLSRSSNEKLPTASRPSDRASSAMTPGHHGGGGVLKGNASASAVKAHRWTAETTGDSTPSSAYRPSSSTARRTSVDRLAGTAEISTAKMIRSAAAAAQKDASKLSSSPLGLNSSGNAGGSGGGGSFILASSSGGAGNSNPSSSNASSGFSNYALKGASGGGMSWTAANANAGGNVLTGTVLTGVISSSSASGTLPSLSNTVTMGTLRGQPSASTSTPISSTAKTSSATSSSSVKR